MINFLKICFMGFLLLVLIVLTYWTDSNIEFWLTHIRGVPTEFPTWISAIFSAVFSVFAVAVNIVSEIIRMFV